MFKQGVRKYIDRGDIDGLKSFLQKDPESASQAVSWGVPSCKAPPIHYLSDGFFNCRWDHNLEGPMAQTLIDAGASVEGPPDPGGTHLHGAASLGCLAVTKVLVESGADIEAKGTYPGIPEGTPLDFAVHFGMVDIVDYLVERGARILSPRMAAGVGSLDALENLLATMNGNLDKVLVDSFRCAAVCDRVEILDYLLTRGLDVNQDIDGATALHWAAWEAKPAMVKHLGAKGANAERSDSKHGMKPVDWARHRRKEVGPRWGHEEVISVLESLDRSQD